MTLLRRIILVSFLAVYFPVSAMAAACVVRGGVLDVPRRGYLHDVQPNLTLDFKSGTSVPIVPLSVTASRIRIRLPATGLPEGETFKVRHHPDHGPAKVVANGRTCPSGPIDPTDPTNSSDNAAAADALAKRANRIPFERATAMDVAAPSGAPEYLLTGSPRETARADAVLLRLGVTVLRREELDSLSLSMLALDLNGVVRLVQLRGELARSGIRVVVDRHSVYQAAQSSADPVAQLLRFDATSPCRLSSAIRIGIVDGPIDTKNPALANVAIRSTSVLSERERQGSTDHATGIAALIAGLGTPNAPAGIAPGAQLYSVVAFARNGGRDVARLENIAEALDWLIQSRVGLVNLSLAGPQNETLAEVVRIADEHGVVMIAATGNNGRSELAYPASDPHVIAVTAIDADLRTYRKANYGKGIGFAAPGVDVLVPSGRNGTSHRSGTSYASAITTAVAAQVMTQGAQGRAAVVAALRQSTIDLGPKGYDERFGWGLITAPRCR